MFSPQGQFAYSIKENETSLLFWNPSDGTFLHGQGQDGKVSRDSLSFSVDGTTVACLSEEAKECRIYDQYGNETNRFKPRNSGDSSSEPGAIAVFEQVAVASAGNLVAYTWKTSKREKSEAFGSQIVNLRQPGFWLWDGNTPENPRELVISGLEHSDWFPIAFVNHEKWLAFAHKTGRLRFWDIESQELQQEEIELGHEYGDFEHGNHPIQFSSDGTRLAFFHLKKQQLEVWDIAPTVPAQLLKIATDDQPAFDVNTQPDISISRDGSLLATKTFVPRLRTSEISVYAIAGISSQAKTLSAEIERTKVTKSLQLVVRSGRYFNLFLLAKDGRHLLSAPYYGSYLWDLSSRNQAHSIRVEGSAWNSQSFSLERTNGTEVISTILPP